MTKGTVKKEKSEEQKLLKKIRETLPTHIVEVEIDMNPKQIKTTNQVLEHCRLIRNTALGQAYTRYEQMIRTKKYRKLLQQYKFVSESLKKEQNKKEIKQLTKRKKELKKELTEKQMRFRLTEQDIQDDCDILRKRFNKALSVFSQTIKTRVWQSIEMLLFKDGKGVNFRSKDQYRSFESKQADRTIILKKNDKDQFFVSFNGMEMLLRFKENDLFIQETFSNIVHYLENSDSINKENMKLLKVGKPLKSTYRIKYNRIVRKEIRGKYRFYLQVVLEGAPVTKRKKDGTFRHTFGTGVIGGDIGTQTVAISSKKAVSLFNLAERTNKKRMQQIVTLQRELDRSRRKTNPDCFDKKGRAIQKMQTKSNTYIKKQKQLRNLQRILAENRKYAHNEKINWIRSLGDAFNIEQMNIKALQKKAKETTKNEKTGKYNRKKRFGKSILNCNPGYFISRAKILFEQTGGKVQEVNTWTFKASQYDHKLDDTNKKQLSQRWHLFEDGTKVQRDLYSSFLLACADKFLSKPDKQLCDQYFDGFQSLHDEHVKMIISNGKKIKNSGIDIPTAS